MKTPSVGLQRRYLTDEHAMQSAFEAAPILAQLDAGCLAFALMRHQVVLVCMLICCVAVSLQDLQSCNKLQRAAKCGGIAKPCQKLVP